MDTLKAIKTKHAVRQFSDQPVPEDVIRQIIDAGRLSQSELCEKHDAAPGEAPPTALQDSVRCGP